MPRPYLTVCMNFIMSIHMQADETTIRWDLIMILIVLPVCT